MKTLSTLALLGALAFSTQVYAETAAENEREIKEGKQAIKKDEAAIRKHEQDLEKLRAEKEAAKANKEYGKQAKESVAIGAKKTVIGAKKVEKKVDQKLLEMDQEDREEYSKQTSSNRTQKSQSGAYEKSENSAYNNRFDNYDNMSPSAGVYFRDSGRADYPVTSKEGPAAKL